jgi:hypothetical protein
MTIVVHVSTAIFKPTQVVTAGARRIHRHQDGPPASLQTLDLTLLAVWHVSRTCGARCEQAPLRKLRDHIAARTRGQSVGASRSAYSAGLRISAHTASRKVTPLHRPDRLRIPLDEMPPPGGPLCVPAQRPAHGLLCPVQIVRDELEHDVEVQPVFVSAPTGTTHSKTKTMANPLSGSVCLWRAASQKQS